MPINFAVKLAATIAVEALQVGLQASRRTTGPRLDELTVTVADFGTPLPRFRGERRFSCPIFHAEDLKEVETTTKVKGGGKQTTYHYLATFAAAIADNPIDKVLKIFFDDKLVYDVTGVGPASLISAITGDGSTDISQYMRIYLGTEDQMPDPRYVEFCEAKYGPNSAPAYRGVSYLFFEELPVDNFGNRIPQISVIAVSAEAASHPYEILADGISLQGASLSPDFTKLVVVSGHAYQVWDIPTRTLIVDVADAGTNLGGGTHIAATSDGFYTGANAGAYLAFVSDGGGITQVTGPMNGGVWNLGVGLRGASGLFGTGILVPDTTSTTTTIATNFYPSWMFDDADGTSWAIGGQVSGGSYTTGFGFYDLTNGVEYLISTAVSGEAMALDNGNDQFFVWQADKIYLVDKATMTIVGGPVSVTGWTGSNSAPFRGVAQGSSTIWLGFEQYSTADLSLLKTESSSSWGSGTGTADPIYSGILDAILTKGTLDTGITVRYLNRASNAGVPLQTIVDAMCDAANLTDRDTSALTQTVKGYSWTRGDVKSQMEPLLDIYDIDARPHNSLIEWKPRGSAPALSILTQDLAKNEDNPRYKVTTKQDTDLPRLLRVNFADTQFDQQTNNVLSPLPADTVDSQRDVVIDGTTWAADPDEAQQKSDRFMRREWNSREAIENSLTGQYLALEPGDVETLDLDGIDQNARLVTQTYIGSRIDCTWVRDGADFAVINSGTTGPTLNRTPQTIVIPAPVKGFVIDAPYRSDSDADVRPLLYDGAGTYAGLTFPGAAIYEASGGVYDTLFATVSTAATWGMCQGTLATANPNLWDRGNTLTVSLQGGSLTNVAEADINADPSLNLIYVGSEWLNFTTATLNGDGSYTLSGFKRGRRGTEWAVGTHAAGEAWVKASSLDTDVMGTDDIGSSLSFKAQSIGRSIDAAAAINITPYTGATLKPYAPARIKWTTDGTDMFGEIIRRTRVGGAWADSGVVSLSENSEAYEIDILDGSSNVLRTITVTGTNTFTYTNAQIVADGGTVGAAPSFNAYQMSDAAGRGFALAA